MNMIRKILPICLIAALAGCSRTTYREDRLSGQIVRQGILGEETAGLEATLSSSLEEGIFSSKLYGCELKIKAGSESYTFDSPDCRFAINTKIEKTTPFDKDMNRTQVTYIERQFPYGYPDGESRRFTDEYKPLDIALSKAIGTLYGKGCCRAATEAENNVILELIKSVERTKEPEFQKGVMIYYKK